MSTAGAASPGDAGAVCADVHGIAPGWLLMGTRVQFGAYLIRTAPGWRRLTSDS
jgi:hypothetical protein